MSKTAAMTILIPKDLHKQFKLISVKKEKSMNKLLIAAIEKIVKEDKKEK